jgi:Na+/H+-dicarboxylate symporter
MDRRLTWYILGGMILGVIVGAAFFYASKFGLLEPSFAKETLSPWLKLLSDIFLHLIKMLVAPLILSTIVVGIAHMGDSSALGRIGFRAISWFIIASLISISLGLLMVNLFQPGIGVDVSSASASAVGEVKKLVPTEFLLSIFPKNAFEALATNNTSLLPFRGCSFVGYGRKRSAAGSWSRSVSGNDAANNELCYALRANCGVRCIGECCGE